MCNLYEYDMTQEDMRLLQEHFELVGKSFQEAMAGRNEPRQVYPNYAAPVVLREGDGHVVRSMRRGLAIKGDAACRPRGLNLRVSYGAGFNEGPATTETHADVSPACPRHDGGQRVHP